MPGNVPIQNRWSVWNVSARCRWATRKIGPRPGPVYRPRIYMPMVPIGSQERRCRSQVCPSFITVWPKFMLPVKLFHTYKVLWRFPRLKNWLLLKFEKRSFAPTNTQNVSHTKIDLWAFPHYMVSFRIKTETNCVCGSQRQQWSERYFHQNTHFLVRKIPILAPLLAGVGRLLGPHPQLTANYS